MPSPKKFTGLTDGHPARPNPRSDMTSANPIAVTTLILETARRIIHELRESDRFEINENSDIYGGNSRFDSLGVMTLIIELEEAVQQKWGQRVPLTDGRAMAEPQVPFKSVPVLTDYLCRRLTE